MKKIFYRTNQSNPSIVAYREAVEKGKKNQHVLPHGNKWVVKSTDLNNGTKTFDTQKKAELYAKSMAAVGTAIFIHDTNGLIKERQDL